MNKNLAFIVYVFLISCGNGEITIDVINYNNTIPIQELELLRTSISDDLMTSDEYNSLFEIILLIEAKYKHIDVLGCTAELNRLLNVIKKACDDKDDKLTVFHEVTKILWSEYDYCDLEDNFNPNNGLLSNVLDTKKGNCLGLSILFVIVGRQLKLPLYLVLVPEHSFVKYSDDNYNMNIEVTKKGLIFNQDILLKNKIVDKNKILINDSISKDIATVIMNIAIINHEKGRYLEANKNMKLVNALYPNMVEKLYKYYGLLMEEKYKELMEYCTSLINDNPQKYKNYYYRSFVYSNMGMYEKAIGDLDKVLSINAFYDMAYYQRSCNYIKLLDYTEALNSINKAIEINPLNSSNYVMKSIVLQKLNKLTLALEELNKGLGIDNNNDTIYYYRALVHYVKNDNIRAIEDLNKAIEINPNGLDSGPAYSLRGQIWYKLQDYDKGLSDLRKSIDLGYETHEDYFKCGIIYKKKGDFKNSIKFLEEAHKINKNNVDPVIRD